MPLPGCPRWLVKPYQEFAFLTTPEGAEDKFSFSRSVVSDHVCEKGRMSAKGH